MEMRKTGIRLCLFIAILAVVPPAHGQLLTSAFDSPQRSNITFSSPVVAGEKSNISFSIAESAPVSPVRPTAPMSTVPVFVAQSSAAPVPGGPRPVAPNTVSKSYRLRLAPQVFERTLVEKLGSRFVPVRNVAEDSGLSRYRLPVRDGTDIELVINQQQGAVFVTGSPKMVDSCLQIVQVLDTEENAGAVTKFVPVQLSNAVPAQRIANILNQETLKVAQVERPNTGSVPRPETGEHMTAGSVVGPVKINTIEGWDTMVIQGSPKDVAVVQGILKQLETLSLESEPIIELVAIKYADSLRVSQLVQQLYAQVYQARRGTVTILPLVKPNTILLIGKQESINGAKELIAKLDTPVNPNVAFQIFPLKHAASDLLANQINQAFTSRPGYGSYLASQVSVVSDSRTNALIVQASPRDLAEVAAMVRKLDVPGSEITSIVKSFPLKNALAQDLVSVLQNAFSNNTNQQRQAMLSLGSVDEEGNLVRSSVLYNVIVVADARSNTLLVTAPPETMPLIEAIIAQLDQLPSAESRIRVFTLANANAYELTTLLINLFTTGAGTGTGTQTNQIATVRPGTTEGESTLVSIRFLADVRTNSIVAIGSEGDLAVAEALLLRLDAENMNSRKTFVMKLVNTPADQIAPILQENMTTERQIDVQDRTMFLPHSPLEQYQKEVNIVAEPISNSLLITTTPRYYEQIRKIIEKLDERPQMVAIDVLIAEVEIKRSKDRGVEFGLQDSILFSAATNTRGNLGIATGTVPFFSTGRTNAVGSQGITSLGVPNTGGFSFAASNEAVSIFIRALETQSRTQVLGRPRLVTLHNKNAAVLVGEKVPYAQDTSVSAGGVTNTSTGFMEVGTVLDVTPRIMPDGMIAMAVYVERSSLIDFEDIGTSRAPYVRNTNAQTTINAMDGQTVIFAGLITEQKRSTNNSIPGLNKIPIIKHFFEYDWRDYSRSELLIVMTPRIIRVEEDVHILNQLERERMSWCASDVVRLTGDSGMRLRSDEWFPGEVRHTYGTPVILNESQLPPENKVPLPMFPTPDRQFPVIETK